MLRTSRNCADAIFRRIKPKTGSKKRDICSANGRTETLHRWQNLFVEVVVDIWLQSAIRLQDFIDRVGVFGCILGRSRRLSSDDEAHDIFCLDVFTLGHEAQSNLHRGHGVAVGIFLRVLSELRVDGVLPRRNDVLTHLLAELSEVIVNLLDDYFRVLTTKKEVE